MGQEMEGEVLGEEYKGYIFRITGGNDKQGFPMKQGVLVNGRVRLLLKKKTTTYRPRRTGERKKKSVRGCIIGPDLAVIALRIEKKGEKDIEGVTDGDKPRRKGPKRANYIRKVFALRKKDDVRKYVVRREIKKKDKTFYKAPKIQRLITEKRLRRKKLEKRDRIAAFKAKKEARAKYDKVLSTYMKEKKAAHDTKAAAAGEGEKAKDQATKGNAPKTQTVARKDAENKGKGNAEAAANKKGTTTQSKQQAEQKASGAGAQVKGTIQAKPPGTKVTATVAAGKPSTKPPGKK